MPTEGIKNSAPPDDRASKEESASSVIVRDVIKGLYEGRYIAGQRMVEPDLMAHYNVSRSSVREALKQLNSDGIVTLAAFRGAQIRKLSRDEARNLFLITEVVLGLAARQAAQRIDAPGEREAITELFSAIADFKEEDGRFEFLQRRSRFFRQMVKMSGNDEIRKILPRLQVHLIRNQLSVPPSERIQGYRQITDALLVGDDRAAEAAARDYVAKTAAFILPHFPE